MFDQDRYGWTDEWLDGWIDGQMNGWMGGLMDRYSTYVMR